MKRLLIIPALALLLAGCTTTVRVPPPTVTIDICNTTVCGLWHARHHHRERER